MKFKKLLGIISIVIIVVFSMMLTTSYAWYAFDNASTVFEGMTNNDDIIVSYQKGEYINAINAIPITAEQVDMYSEKNNFNIKVKNNVKDNEMLASISLVGIKMSGSLQKDTFRIELYHQSEKVADIGGNNITTPSSEDEEVIEKLADVILDNDVTNNFELRVYILDNGEEQGYTDKNENGEYDRDATGDASENGMMNCTFQAKIKVNVISRLKNSLNEYNDPDIYISSVTIDGEASDYIPTDGYYSMTATCSKGSNLTWDPLSKTITYNSGSYVNDNCSLAFTSSTDYPLLSEMPVGSYVKYTGTNGCEGIHCEGYNANYVSDTDMGFCNSSDYDFTVNGWRLAYVEEGSPHLISAGAPECVKTYVDDHSTSLSSATWSTAYYYGSGYTFDESTGKYTLTGLTSTALAWSSNYASIIANTPYTCKSTSNAATCSSAMYKVDSTSTSSSVKYYTYYAYEQTGGAPKHLANLNNKALKYCNKGYVKGGECNNTTAWAMNASDFDKITGNALNSNSCYGSSLSNRFACGYTNDLIDNGGYYWFATPYSTSSGITFYWRTDDRYVFSNTSNNLHGVRPVLALESSIRVMGGKGTYKDPYVISKVVN